MVLGLILAGCTAPDLGGDAQSDGVRTPADGTPTRSLSLASEQPVPSGSEVVTGRLGADAVEGGCGYIQAVDGTRYEVRYPAGWKLTLNPLQLAAPDGAIVARGGDEVTVRGVIADDVASTCQIGPIFRATEVVR